MKEPHLKAVMTPFPYSVSLEEPLARARKLMLEHHVRHLPVTVDHELKGLISDRDIKLLLGPELGSPDPKQLTVEDAYVDNDYRGIFTEMLKSESDVIGRVIKIPDCRRFIE